MNWSSTKSGSPTCNLGEKSAPCTSTQPRIWLVITKCIAEIGVAVIEAFTPPPVGGVSIREARQFWGQGTIIWINFPETIFWSGPEATKQYTKELLQGDAPGDRLVISFTEMGLWGAADDETGKVFKNGTLAILDAIDEYGVYPVKG